MKRNGKQRCNKGTGPENTTEDNNESGCGIGIETSKLPVRINTFITKTHAQKAAYYYVKRVEVCKENGKITNYVVIMDGPNSITLYFDTHGPALN